MKTRSVTFSAEGTKKLDSILKRKNYPAWMAFKHHRTHENKRLDFEKHQYLKQLYLDEAAYIAIMKCVQSAVSEYLHNRAQARAIQGRSIFYVLPTDRLVYRVVRNRIDKEIMFTPILQAFSGLAEEKTKVMYRQAQSMSMKQFGMGTIAFVPSNSEPAFAEFKADEIIVDEQDECDPENLVKAWERLGHSEYRMQVRVGNPTIDMPGTIAEEYNATDRKQWNTKCQHCGYWDVFDWFKNVVREIEAGRYMIRDEAWNWEDSRDINIICAKCGKPKDRYADGKWIKTAESIKSGYHINQMFAGTYFIKEILERFMEGITNPTKMQRFYNASLGLPFTDKGARIDEDMLNACLGEMLNGQKSTAGVGIMGVDVNDTLNVTIGRLLPDMSVLVTYILEMPQSVNDLLVLAIEHDVRFIVLDGLPEQYFVRKIKSKFTGRGRAAFACFYTTPKDDIVDKRRNVTVDRTASLDEVKSIISLKNMIFPIDAATVPDFYNQVTVSVRVFDPKMGKFGAFVWREGNRDDHFFHSLNYLVLAAKIAKRYSR